MLSFEEHYRDIIKFIKRHDKNGQLLTRAALEEFIKTKLDIKYPRFVVAKLIKLKYIKQEKPIIIFIKGSKK